MLDDVLALRRGFGRSLYILDSKGNYTETNELKPYCYSTKKTKVGLPVEEVTKKIYWTDEEVKTWKTVFDTPRDLTFAKERFNAPIFEFDLSHTMRKLIDDIRSEPQAITATVYDVETDMDNDNAFTSCSLQPISIDKFGFLEELEPVWYTEDIVEVAQALKKRQGVAGHNIQWFDNTIIEKYFAGATLKQFMPHPNPNVVHVRHGYPIKDKLNLDTYAMAIRFVPGMGSYGLKNLTKRLKLGEVVYIPPRKIARVSQSERERYNNNDVKVTTALLKELAPALWAAWNILKIPPESYMNLPGKGALDVATFMFAQKMPGYYIPCKERFYRHEGEYTNPQNGKYQKYQIIGGKTYKPHEIGAAGQFFEGVTAIDFKAAYPNYVIENDISPELREVDHETELKGVLVDKTGGPPKTVYLEEPESATWFSEVAKEMRDVSNVYKEKAKKDPKWRLVYRGVKGSFSRSLTQGVMSVERKLQEDGTYKLSSSRFINLPAASTITNSVREKIITSAGIVREHGKLLLGDTDGLYLKPGDLTGREIMDLCEEATGLELDLDEIFVAFFCKGKTYAYIDKNGVTLKGVVLKGRDKTQACVDVAKEVIEDLLNTRKYVKTALPGLIGKKLIGKYFAARDDDSKILDFTVHIKVKKDYKSPHLRMISKYYMDTYGVSGSFDGVVVGDKDVKSLKPWGASDWYKHVKPVDMVDPSELNMKWYRMVAENIIAKFLGVKDLKQGDMSTWLK